LTEELVTIDSHMTESGAPRVWSWLPKIVTFI